MYFTHIYSRKVVDRSKKKSLSSAKCTNICAIITVWGTKLRGAHFSSSSFRRLLNCNMDEFVPKTVTTLSFHNNTFELHLRAMSVLSSLFSRSVSQRQLLQQCLHSLIVVAWQELSPAGIVCSLLNK